MRWTDGTIHDCKLTPLRRFSDDRGWLSEIFRVDEPPDGHELAMAYISETLPGVARGPHEHVAQTDLFAFFDGIFRVFLWDNRVDSPTYGTRQVFVTGRENPTTLRVPPGVVHAYRCESEIPSLILNCPDKLYAGPGRAEEVDEVRHEDEPDSPFRMDGA
ncbi:MAG: dTDP-4-dehydrorhamnose 3,5-epimerase [Rhodothermales bacterium]|jgi:dTDP-4-dehydrorhamnose 3,5-epimerase